MLIKRPAFVRMSQLLTEIVRQTKYPAPRARNISESYAGVDGILKRMPIDSEMSLLKKVDLAEEPLPESLAERHAGIPCIMSSSFTRSSVVDRLTRRRQIGGGADRWSKQVEEEVGDVFERHPPPALLQLYARFVEGDAQSTARKGDRG
ncbi:hypothetical protein B296_00031839, partial [Ensete ventricosum]